MQIWCMWLLGMKSSRFEVLHRLILCLIDWLTDCSIDWLTWLSVHAWFKPAVHTTSSVVTLLFSDIIQGMNPMFQAPELATVDSYWTSMSIISPTQWYWKYRGNGPTNMWTLPMAFYAFAPGIFSEEFSTGVLRWTFLKFRCTSLLQVSRVKHLHIPRPHQNVYTSPTTTAPSGQPDRARSCVDPSAKNRHITTPPWPLRCPVRRFQ